MNQDTNDFIQTWTEKIAAIEGDGLGEVFNRYTSLYTLYNRLYNDSYRELKNSNSLNKSRYSDFEKATTLVVQFNSANDIIERITANNNLPDIDAIANLIKNDIFHINLADGVSQKNTDLQLLSNLTNADVNIKAQAVVSTIYNVRNNMQHGEKHFEEHQRLLLEPLTRLLQTVIDLQIEKLT